MLKYKMHCAILHNVSSIQATAYITLVSLNTYKSYNCETAGRKNLAIDVDFF